VICDRDKGLHGVDAIHGIISYIAIMKCQLSGLLKFLECPRWLGGKARFADL